MPGGKQEDAIWKQVQKNAKDQFGITLKFVNFTDGISPIKLWLTMKWTSMPFNITLT